MSNQRNTLLFLSACLAAAPAVSAADALEAELITDRPDQTESALTVQPGRLLLETGALWVEDEEQDVATSEFELIGTLLRIGVSRRTELRIGWLPYVAVDTTGAGIDEQDSGTGNATLGVKQVLAEEQGHRPQTALLVRAVLPTGNLGSDEIDPAFRFLFSNTLTDRLAIGYNVGMVWRSTEGDDGRTHTLSSYLYTASLGIGLGERFAAYVEAFGFIPASAGGGPLNSVNGGFTFLAARNVQLDIAGGVGVSEAAPDWFVGAGLSARFPR